MELIPDEGPEFWWNWAVYAGAAVATFAAVLVALFGQAFRAKFFPPKLSLSLLSKEGEKTRTQLQWRDDKGETHQQIEDSRYYHLQVSNARGWSSATEVQVMLLQIQEQAANGEFRVGWTGVVPFRWAHQEIYPASRTIGKSPARVDLCSVVKGKWLQIHLLLTPLNVEAVRREACTFILTLQAQGSEAMSAVVPIRVSWNGQWHDGDHEMRQHCVVEQLGEAGGP